MKTMIDVNQNYQNLLRKHKNSPHDLKAIDKLYRYELRLGLPDIIAQENVLEADSFAKVYQMSGMPNAWRQCFSDLTTLIINVQ